MRSPNVRKPAAGRASREIQRRRQHHNVPERSAQNWLLDAAVYAFDGDRVKARMAALRGVLALERERP